MKIIDKHVHTISMYLLLRQLHLLLKESVQKCESYLHFSGVKTQHL